MPVAKEFCKWFNTPGTACRLPAGTCNFKHETYCTNPLCVGKNSRHTLKECGRVGGGAHEAYIGQKCKESMAKKAEKKAAANHDAESVCSQLLPKVDKILTQMSAEGVSAGKIVGMFHDAYHLDIKHLTELLENQEMLLHEMLDAAIVLDDYAADQSKAHTTTPSATSVEE